MAMKRKGEEAFGGDFRNNSSFRPKKVCTFFLEGRCQKGPACTFAHSGDELHPEAPIDGMADQMAMADAKVYEQDTHATTDDFFEQLQADLGNGGSGGCVSSLQGPREFAAAPNRLCSIWLRHPALCEKGDECPNAHGLAEMGLAMNASVRLQTSSDRAPVRVELVSGKGAPVHQAQPVQLFPGGGAGKGFDKSKGSKKGFFDKGYDKGYDKGCKGGKPSFAAMPALGYDKGCKGGKDFGGKGDKGKGGKAGLSEGRFPPGGFMPAKLCQFWVTDPSQCTKGDACSFAHGVQELTPAAVASCGISRFHHTGFKPAQICTFYQQGTCQKNFACTYAHSEEELHGM